VSNTHIAVAKFRQEGVHEWQSEEGSTEATNIAAALDAQTEATLALVYEQRTANLIALLTAGRIELTDGSIGLMDERLMQLQQEVLERLDD
jgi:hypothetical protein